MFNLNLYLDLIMEYRINFRKSQDKWSLTEDLVDEFNNIIKKKKDN